MKAFTHLITLVPLFGINLFLIDVLATSASREEKPKETEEPKSDNDEVPKPKKTPISLDLSNFNPNDFILIKSTDGPEAYKISPKDTHEFDIITMGSDFIWTTDLASKCLGITIYESKVQEIYLALDIVENGVFHTLHFLKNQDLSYIGLIEFLDLINSEYIYNEKNSIKRLDISDEFSKLFFMYFIKEDGNRTYESYETNYEEDVITEIVDGDYTIFQWETGCESIEIYKQDGNYLLASIELTDGDSLFLKYDETNKVFVQTNEKIYENLISQMELRIFRNLIDKRFEYKLENFLDKEHAKLDKSSVDISTKKRMWEYTSGNVMDNRFVIFRQTNPNVINTISDKGLVILEGEMENVYMTYLRTSTGRFFLEVAWSLGELRSQNIYLEKDTSEGKWNKISQQDFHGIFSKHIAESNPPSTMKYLHYKGLTSGEPIAKLPEETQKKINSLTDPLENTGDKTLTSKQAEEAKNKEEEEKKSSFYLSSIEVTFVITGLALFWI